MSTAWREELGQDLHDREPVPRDWAKATFVASMIAAFTALLFATSAPTDLWLNDLGAYVRAANDLRDGVDPYRSDVRVMFVYHPATLSVLRWLDALPWGGLRSVFALAYLFVGIVFVLALVRAMRHAWLFVFAFALAFGSAGFTSLATGNVTTFLHLALLAALLFSNERGRDPSPAFVVVLAIAIAVKPYFVAYTMLFPLRRGITRRSVSLALITTLPAALVYTSYALWAPDQTSAFLAALRHQTIGKDNYGIAVFALLMRLLHRPALCLFLHAVLTGTLLWLSTKYARTERAGLAQRVEVALLLYFALSWVNPRMMIYDFFPSVICLFGLLARRASQPTLSAVAASVLGATPLLLGQGFDFVASLRSQNPLLLSLLESQALWQMAGCALLIACVLPELARAVSSSDALAWLQGGTSARQRN